VSRLEAAAAVPAAPAAPAAPGAGAAAAGAPAPPNDDEEEEDDEHADQDGAANLAEAALSPVDLDNVQEPAEPDQEPAFKKILVFSQSVQMLKFVRHALSRANNAAESEYPLFDGSLSSRYRGRCCARALAALAQLTHAASALAQLAPLMNT
jgi:hypothetical protein